VTRPYPWGKPPGKVIMHRAITISKNYIRKPGDAGLPDVSNIHFSKQVPNPQAV